MALFLFTVHFVFTGLYLSPINPIKTKNSSLINTYMNPLFTQNWKLFAPEPVSKNNTFLVRAQFNNGETTDWINLTSYLIDKNFKNRFSPYNRLVRIQRGAFNALYEKDDVTIQIMNKIQDEELDEEDYKEFLENDEQTERAIELLNRYTQSYLRVLYPNKDIKESQVLIEETESIPYSKKDEENIDTEKQVLKLDWEDYEKISPIF